MALGGLSVLQERGIPVPEQVKIIGFDDSEFSAFSSPPLTSIRQPIYEEGWLAGKTLLQAIKGFPIPKEQTIDVTLISRASCGCAKKNEAQKKKDAERGIKTLPTYQKTISNIKVITDQIGTILSLQDLAREFARLQAMITKSAAFICLYDTETQNSWRPETHAHLITAVNETGEIIIDPSHPRRFLCTQLVPAYLLSEKRCQTLIVRGLFKEPRNFGYLVQEYRGEDPCLLESIRDHVSAALFNIALTEEGKIQRNELQHALARAEESEKRYRELAVFLPTIIMETDERGRIIFLNNAGKEVFDLTDTELAEKPSFPAFFETSSEYSLETIQSDAEKSYRKLPIHTRSGKNLTLLIRSSIDPHNPNTIRWNGINFVPIINSLMNPDVEVFREYHLSNREQEILTLMLAGLIGKEIARHLNLSLSTVKSHITSIYRKIGVGSRDQLFSCAREKLASKYGFDTFIFSLIAQLLRE